jgi:hypothetical protein
MLASSGAFPKEDLGMKLGNFNPFLIEGFLCPAQFTPPYITITSSLHLQLNWQQNYNCQF